MVIRTLKELSENFKAKEASRNLLKTEGRGKGDKGGKMWEGPH